MMQPTQSMQRQLLTLQWLIVLFIGMGCGALSTWLVWQHTSDWRGQTLEQIAQSVVRHGVESEDPSIAIKDDGQFISQVWNASGDLDYSSAKGIDQAPPRQSPGSHQIEWHDQQWHVHTLVEDDLTIQVSQPMPNWHQELWALLPSLGGVLLGTMLLLYVLLRRSVLWSLRPLQMLSSALNENPLAPQLGAWAQQQWPKEVQPLVRTLGQVFHDLEQAKAAQQHLIARAAHEFRTPLAALKVHAQLLGKAKQAEHQAIHNAHLLVSVERIARLVDQLLTLARYDAQTGAPQVQESFQASACVEELLPIWHSLAQAHHVELDVQLPFDAWAQGDAQAVRAMLDNVVHNAIRHSAAHTQVSLAIHETDAHWVWTVVDHGPGMSPAQIAQIGQRFVHSSAPQVNQGSGLGLAIAQKVAQLHHGHLQLTQTPHGGLTVAMYMAKPMC